MEEWEEEVRKHWDRVADSEWYKSLRTEERLDRLKKDPGTAFHPEMLSLLKKHMGSFAGKKILLPSSGDNHAAFAFALMGAKVTSADISERQLENAKVISDGWGLDIEYVCDNTMYLSQTKDASYDLVYTSNGTLTWIGDLNEMYRNISRVLKVGGYSAVYDMHPFNRPFAGEAWKAPEIRKSYYDVFPDLHWRVQDVINSIISAGLAISEMAELPATDASFWYTYDELKTKKQEETENINDWKSNPMAAIPAWLAVIARKSV
ncbi:MAG: class I SAM-dependent methyltransferase [Oscillospiraceae bacterium]|nr:class I SAM-dependent methyltransferase [Oscillospiraceae bacterium]